MSDIIKLVGDACDEVSLVDSKNPYKNGKKAEEGKTFSRFKYNGVLFTVDDASPFIADFAAGDIAMIKLIEGERIVETKDEEGNDVESVRKTFEFDTHQTLTKAERRAQHAFKINRLSAIETAISNGKMSMEEVLATV